MKKVLLLLAIVINSTISSYAQGLKLATDEQLDNVEVWVNDDLGFSDQLPTSYYELEKYCPPPVSQGNDATCVGYAIGYAAMSTMYNHMMGITDPFVKYALAFDPDFMYSVLRSSSDVTCNIGLYLDDAMIFLKDYGNKRWAMQPYLTCATSWNKDNWSTIRFYTQPFSLIKVFQVETAEDVKWFVSNNYPVIIGVNLEKSIYPLGATGGTVGSNGLWIPKSGESLGGHAMTVVGYDDNKYGGSFRIMNSWGSKYGDNGFIWIKYSDFDKIVREAWAMLPKLLKSDNANETIYTDNYTRYYFEGKNAGDVYEGTYWDDAWNGLGYYQWKSGNILFAIWKDGKPNGRALYFDYEKRKLIDFYYEDGVVISSEERGFSSNQNSDLDTYLKTIDIGIELGQADESTEIPEFGIKK